MQVIESISELREAISARRETNQTSVGFVPTMGALHEGHLSLVKRCSDENDVTVVSIFVNPTQFNDENDFKTYPRDNAKDLGILDELGNVDIVFMPQAEDVFPKGSKVSIDPGPMADVMCGMSRGGHFRGVLTVVLKLFNMVQPDVTYFGAKDYQQFALIAKMVEDFNLPIQLILGDTIREEDGLAMSSRNQLLNPADREEAPALYQALEQGYKMARQGETSAMKVMEMIMTGLIENTCFEVDYVSIVNPIDLEELTEIDLKQPFLIGIAAYMGPVRLIDNILHVPT